MLIGTAVLGTNPLSLSAQSKENMAPVLSDNLKNNIHHSVCYWCYGSIPFEEFCQQVKAIGLTAVDLVKPDQWPILQKYGLTCSMSYGGDIGITKGWNDPQYHEQLVKNFTDVIPQAAAHGYKNIICFSGNREGKDDETGLKHCTEGLKKIIGLAEKHKVTIVMELLNSKVNHPDYQCDHTAWGVALCNRLGSENFKLLYDIYHMQIMEGDVIRTIKDYHRYIAHYHTGGNPGRHEIDETQELYYPAIMRAILETGYQGYVAQEFVPTTKDNKNKIASLERCVKICDV